MYDYDNECEIVPSFYDEDGDIEDYYPEDCEGNFDGNYTQEDCDYLDFFEDEDISG